MQAGEAAAQWPPEVNVFSFSNSLRREEWDLRS
jgi:hypothetical protein